MSKGPSKSEASAPVDAGPPAAGRVRVYVVLLGTFADYVPRGERGPRIVVDLPGPAPLRAVRARLGVSDDTPRIVFRRGDTIDDDQLLLDGDEVSFVSPIAGG